MQNGFKHLIYYLFLKVLLLTFCPVSSFFQVTQLLEMQFVAG